MAAKHDHEAIRELIARAREARESEFREDGRDFWEANAHEMIGTIEGLLETVLEYDRLRKKRGFAQRAI